MSVTVGFSILLALLGGVILLIKSLFTLIKSEKRLWVIFWGYGVFVGFALLSIANYLFLPGVVDPDLSRSLSLLVMVVLLAYGIFYVQLLLRRIAQRFARQTEAIAAECSVSTTNPALKRIIILIAIALYGVWFATRFLPAMMGYSSGNLEAVPHIQKLESERIQKKVIRGDADEIYETAHGMQFSKPNRARELFDKAIAIYLEKAKANDVNAQMRLSSIYLYGQDGFAVDCEAAIKWATAAAEQDIEVAMRRLGDYYSQYSGGKDYYRKRIQACPREVDYEAALKWYRKAAIVWGDWQSRDRLLELYGEGGAKQDLLEAYSLQIAFGTLERGDYPESYAEQVVYEATREGRPATYASQLTDAEIEEAAVRADGYRKQMRDRESRTVKYHYWNP